MKTILSTADAPAAIIRAAAAKIIFFICGNF